MSLAGTLRKYVLGISPEDTSFARRGFRETHPDRRRRLERVGSTFVEGYHAGLRMTRPAELGLRLDKVELQWQGFAYEGAAMALALLDLIAPWKRNRWKAFLEGPGAEHAYMVHVGAGWAAARVPWVRRNLGRRIEHLDPLLRWLVVDGYGFHEGFFHWTRYADGRAVPEQLTGYAPRAFDQGLGRCLWFIEGADVSRVVATINSFPSPRRPDLFAGIGLACTYAGGVDEDEMENLREAAGAHWPQLAQGSAFAAKARQRAGNLIPHTELACRTLCGMSAEEAAAITDHTLADLPPDPNRPAYELWRQRIQETLAAGRIATGKTEMGRLVQ